MTLAVPVANTAARSTNTAFDKCYLSSQDCPTTGAYDSLTWDDGTGAAALPSWITFSSSGSTSQTVAINPPDGTVLGSHSLIAVFNPTNGADKTFTAYTFTVTCEVTSWTVPSAPTEPTFDLTYAVFETPLAIDISSLAYTQSPACGYTFTSVYSWNGLTGFMSESPAGSGKIIVSSSNLANVGSHSVYFTNAITISSNGPAGSSTFTLNQVNDQVSFSVTVTDPCSASTASALVFRDPANSSSVTTMAVTDGLSITVDIDAPTNSFSTSEGVADRCGKMTASVYTNNDGTDTNPTNNWASLSGPDATTGKYVLTIDTTADLSLIAAEAQVSHVIYVKTTLSDYSSQTQYSAFTVVIDEATCDCTHLAWTNPSATAVSVMVAATSSPTFPVPTADTSATATNNAFSKCYLNGGSCDTGGTFPAASVVYDDGSASGTSLPSWMTYTESGSNSQTIALAPLDGTARGVHTIRVIYSSTYGPNP